MSAETGADVDGIKSGGAAWMDFDADGWPDVALSRSRDSSVLLRNTGGQFEDVTSTHAPGFLASPAIVGMLAADVDNDGYVDLTRVGATVIEVWLNTGPAGDPPYSFPGDENGDADFVVAASEQNFGGAVWVDVQRDGWLDLMFQQSGYGLAWFSNDQRQPLSMTLDFSSGLPTTAGEGDHFTVGDLDLDGDFDVVARLAGAPDIWRNSYSDTGEGTFSSSTLFDYSADVGDPGGVALCDLNHDGWQDIVRGRGGEDLSSGQLANQVFAYNGSRITATGAPGHSSDDDVNGVACIDADLDGDLDLYFTGGQGGSFYESTLAQGGASFEFDPPENSWAGQGAAEGAAVFADYDLDGDPDLLLNQVGPNSLWRNDFSGGAGLKVQVKVDLAAVDGRCEDDAPTRDDIGATVKLYNGDFTLAWTGDRVISGGEGVTSMSFPEVMFGLPEGPQADYVVRVDFGYAGPISGWVPVNLADLNGAGVLRILSSDMDGDSILTDDEWLYSFQAGADFNLDGDAFQDWGDPDTDGDGLSDSEEAGDADLCTPPVDTDDDGEPDFRDTDSDNDSLLDAEELAAGTDPRQVDTDGDGLDDGKESAIDTDPLNPDTDGDGLLDGEEYGGWGTDPLVFDTDGGGVGDGDEVAAGTDPLDPSDDGLVPDDGPQALAGGLSGWSLGCAGAPSGPAAMLTLAGLLMLGRRRARGTAAATPRE